MMSISLQDFKYTTSIEIRWRDLDAMNHVNNSVYLTYLEQARTHYMHDAIQWDWKTDGLILANVNIAFKVALILTDKPIVHVRCTHIGNKSFTLQCCITTVRNDETIVAAFADTVLVVYDYKNEKTLPLSEEKRLKLQSFEGMIE